LNKSEEKKNSGEDVMMQCEDTPEYGRIKLIQAATLLTRVQEVHVSSLVRNIDYPQENLPWSSLADSNKYQKNNLNCSKRASF
jgi:hypothetical protein